MIVAYVKAEDAGFYYQNGVEAKSIGERETNFEKALKLYMEELVALKDKNSDNGYLLYNIGNCYFNLNQLGEAILYYKQALKYLPNEENVIKNYQIACQKRVNPIDIEKSSNLMQTLLFFHFKISLNVKNIIMFALSIIALLLFILGLMTRYIYLKKLFWLSISLYFIMLGSIYFEIYHPLREGVLMKESLVYQEAGEAYASLIEKPVGEGSMVRVISFTNGWYKVQLNDGRFGYIKESILKIVL